MGALLATPAAGAPFLSQPIDCDLGDTCFIQNYVDHDPSQNHADFTCNTLSYDGHKGTDFALPSRVAMQAGVDVLAAADGLVTGVRDGIEDRVVTAETLAELNGKDCGNGVSIDHGDGWVTQYCHMKQTSLVVASGEKVKRGQKLGHVGLSGRTQYPHVHISVRHDGAVVDPFHADAAAPCGANNRSLWQHPIDYVATGVIRVGFETKIPKYSDIQAGVAGRAEITSDAPALVLFSFGFGSRPGDVLKMSITGPSGPFMNQSITLDKTQAQYFRAVGKRANSGGWPTGAYLGTVELSRDGILIERATNTVMIRQ